MTATIPHNSTAPTFTPEELAAMPRVAALEARLKDLNELRATISQEIAASPPVRELIELRREMSKVESAIHSVTGELFRLRGTLKRPVRGHCKTCGLVATFMIPINKQGEYIMAAPTTEKKFRALADTNPEAVNWVTDAKGKCRCPTCGRVRAPIKPLTDKQKAKAARMAEKARERVIALAKKLGVDPAALIAGGVPAAAPAAEPAAEAPKTVDFKPAVNGTANGKKK